MMMVKVKKSVEFRWQVIPKTWCSDEYGCFIMFYNEEKALILTWVT